jgi:16S rRNA (guanine966-N2)-methyltransferase
MKARRPANQVRIIAGAWRGRRLVFDPASGVRPSPDRVRETLFNWLGPAIRGARCLDLFAGSGALGLEAASRGAAEVVLVDSDPRVTSALQGQVRQLDARGVRIVQAEVLGWLAGQASVFDVVFLDPPFRRQLLSPCMRRLEAGGWLADPASIYLEGEKDASLELPANWELLRSKTAGQVGYHLARRNAAQTDSA